MDHIFVKIWGNFPRELSNMPFFPILFWGHVGILLKNLSKITLVTEV